ncbi:MAG: hypothetical protein H0V59_08705 [Nocardioidaceae bacterium]|nr:hypothetical protein [Nocardioidaceae bacterium]
MSTNPPAGVFSVGAAVSYGWNRFKANTVQWVLIMLVIVVISVTVDFAFGGLDYASDDADADASLAVTFTLAGVGSALATAVINSLLHAAVVRGSLDETFGRKASFESVLRLGNIVDVVLAGLLTTVLTLIGLLLFVLPGIVFAFVSWFTLMFVLDKQQSPVTAVMSSVTLVSASIGPCLLLALASIGIVILGFLACGVGVLAALPVVSIASAYAYRALQGEGAA